MKDKVEINSLKAVARVAGFLGVLCVGLVIQHPDSVFASTYSVGLTTSGTINIDVSTSGIGAAVATDNLVATSTCPLGYTITIQGPTDTNLYKDGSSSNNNTNTKITPSAGTIASPLPIAGDNGSGGTYNGTWGYSLTSSTSTGTFIGLSNTSAILTSKNTGSGDGTSTTDTIPVYYGVSTLPTQEPGIYSLANAGKINYFITTPLSCTSNAVTLSLTDASAIVIDDTPYTASDSPVSLSYGTHTISGTFSQGYEFDSWSTTGDIAITDASASSTIINVTGDGTLSLIGKKATPLILYDAVAAMSKGTQTLAGLRTAITTANSGVYEYNTSVFGAATDAASTHTIYYYRGILDQTTGSYGSDGDGKAWPNYVILDEDGTKDTNDTCWRIIRTTGSGGVKMIYNGKWTGSTCANAQSNAQVTTKTFGGTAEAVYRSIVGVGYTRNANYTSTSATTATAYSTLFGSDTSYSDNSTASDMKTYLEGTWFTNISSYENILEKSAGWCNDRSIRSSNSSTTVIGDSTTIVPYGTSGMTEYYFGSYVRTRTTSDKPTLGCPRSNADLYTTSSATNGNKQLGKPVALITVDEAAFAGSGYNSSTIPYHANSFLRSGSNFWLFSPYARFSGGNANGFRLSSDGYLSGYGVNNAFGVRPSISLASGIVPASGSGTATDPWVILPPPTMQDTAVADLSEGEEKTVIDARDGKDYTIKKINGQLWMTQNLRFTGTSVPAATSNVTADKTITYYQLDTDGDASGEKCNGTTGYSNACIKDSGSTTTGVWYNYYAATAGTKSGSSNSTAASQDICPKNWHLPTGPNTTTNNTDINKLVGNTTSGWQDSTAGLTAFGAVAGGSYRNGSLGNTGYGHWWSATANGTTDRYTLNYNSSDGQFRGDGFNYRYYGYFVRCVRSS